MPALFPLKNMDNYDYSKNIHISVRCLPPLQTPQTGHFSTNVTSFTKKENDPVEVNCVLV